MLIDWLNRMEAFFLIILKSLQKFLFQGIYKADENSYLDY